MTRTVLITGGNRGIGQQVARVLANDGWDVLVGARDRKKGEAAVARLRKDGARLKVVELDVSNDDSVATCAQKLRDGAIRIDALINNAGIYRDGTDAAIIETNFFGPLRMTLAMLPLLRDGGSITNVTSDLGSLSNFDREHRALLTDPALTRVSLCERMRTFVRDGESWGTDTYGVSKAALDALTRLFASELASRNIRVNSTSPGWVRTEMGGRGAPRSVEQGAASVLFGVTTQETGGVFRDGRRIS